MDGTNNNNSEHSNENDTILDTFLGSGTTSIACKNLNRKFKGCEKSTEYFNNIVIRHES